MKQAERKPCFCGSGRPFSRCCQPYLQSNSQAKSPKAPTAEALMRSRFSAFCQGNIDYLISTHHPDARTSDEAKTLMQTVKTVQWTHLQVISKQKGQKKDQVGTVEFVAVYRSQSGQLSKTFDASGDGLAQLHERSKFVKEGGRWFYLKGDVLPPYVPGRSQPCWCGSRKPFKYCHG